MLDAPIHLKTGSWEVVKCEMSVLQGGRVDFDGNVERPTLNVQC